MFFRYISQYQTVKSQHSNWTQLPSVGPPDNPLPFTYFLQSWKHYFSIWLERTTRGQVLENFRTAFPLSTNVRVINATFLNIKLSSLFGLQQSLFFKFQKNYYNPGLQVIVFWCDSRSAARGTFRPFMYPDYFVTITAFQYLQSWATWYLCTGSAKKMCTHFNERKLYVV